MENLDPTIVALTRAIKKNETGEGDTYNLKSGADGEIGAYQFLPSTWKTWAKEHLGDSNAPATMENQNKVAYAQVKKYKDAGYNPGQIASLWNHGTPDPTGVKGRSKGGALYDTPAYVQRVYADYEKYKGAMPQNPAAEISGSTPPTPEQPQIHESMYDSILNSPVSKFIQNFFPGKQVGEAIGTLAGYINSPNKEQYDLSAPTPLQVAGDIGQGALMTVAPGLGAESTVASRIGVNALAGAAFGGSGAIAEGKPIGEVGKETLIGGAIGGTLGAAFEAGSAIFKGIRNILNKAGGKTLEEVLATAPQDVNKLSATERKAYFDAQKELINQSSKKAEMEITAELQKKSEQSINDIKQLSSEVDKASRDEAIALKPKVLQSLKDQSNTYTKLVEEGIAKAENATVNKTELSNFINSKFEEDTQQLLLAKKQLGLSDEVLEGEVALEDLYKKTKELRQTMGSSAIRGGRTFTPDELATDKTVNALLEFMKTKGVDLTEANQFWAKWAPLRNRIVREVKPFDVQGIEKMPISRTLKQTTSDSQNFIESLENLIGEKIGVDVKKAMEGLSKAQRDKITDKIESETQKMNVRLQKKLDLGKIKADEFEAARLANRRAIIRKILLSVGIVIGAPVIIKHAAPFIL